MAKGSLSSEHYEGGCHCGAVRFRVEVERHVALDCNCSICRMKGNIHLIVPRDRFTLLKGESELTTYQFHTGVAKHTFCRICGIHPFYVPRSHPHGIDVNVRCLDDPDALGRFEVETFDGRRWEESAAKIGAGKA
jgi:hypothetical protein